MQPIQPERDIYIAVYGQVDEKHSLEINKLLAAADHLGQYQTPAQFTLYQYQQKPVVIRDGNTPLDVSIYAIDITVLKKLDDCFHYPTIHDRIRFEIQGIGDVWLYVMSEGYAALAGVYQNPLRQEKTRQNSAISA